MSPRWNWLPDPETRAAVLRHPFVLAGLAVVVLLGLTAGALVVVDSARGSKGGTPTVVVDAVTTSSPGPTAMTATASGVTGATNAVTAVRAGPGASTQVLGTLDQGDDVVIDGRSADSQWYRVIFPPQSELHGWIAADSVDVTGDPASLAVATPDAPVLVEVPTEPPSVLTAISADLTPTAAATPSVTATPADNLPDLVIGTTPTIVDGKLFVTVVDQGKGDAVGDIVVTVFNQAGTKLLAGATLPKFTLKAGRSIDIGTGYDVTENQTLLLIVNPNEDIPETDYTNNRVVVAVAIGNPTPTSIVPQSETPAVPPSATPAP